MIENWKLVEQIIKDIKAGKLAHDQRNWHCGTAHCIAGWFEIKKMSPYAEFTYEIVDKPLNVVTVHLKLPRWRDKITDKLVCSKENVTNLPFKPYDHPEVFFTKALNLDSDAFTLQEVKEMGFKIACGDQVLCNRNGLNRWRAVHFLTSGALSIEEIEYNFYLLAKYKGINLVELPVRDRQPQSVSVGLSQF